MNQVYRAFLLRLWKSTQGKSMTWRLSLEDPHTRQVMQFQCLKELTDYLSEITQLNEGSSSIQVDSQESFPKSKPTH